MGQFSWTAALAGLKQGHWSEGINARDVVAIRAGGTGGLYELVATRQAFNLYGDDHNRWERLRKDLGFVNAGQPYRLVPNDDQDAVVKITPAGDIQVNRSLLP